MRKVVVDTRKSKEELDKIKNKLGVDILWSWSRFNNYKTDPYGYMLKYIKKIPEQDKTSIWGISGGSCHEIISDYYESKITYEQMLEEYEDKLFEMNAMELKYNKVDSESNSNIANNYETSIKLFFENYKPIETNVIIEKFITVRVGKYVFQGYIDFMHKDKDGNYIIEDFKTSTIYVGKKKDKESGQLLLYSQALLQKGIPIEKIKLRWNFLKYCTINFTHMINVTYMKETKGQYKETTTCCKRNEWVSKIVTQLKKDILVYNPNIDKKELKLLIDNAKDNNTLEELPQEVINKYTLSDVTRNGLRSKFVESISTQLRKDLKEYGYDELEIEDKYQSCVDNNTLDLLDEDIAKNYKMEDCYVYIDLDNEIIDELNKNIIETLDTIVENTNKTKELLEQVKDTKDKKIVETINNKIDEMWWSDISKTDEYYYYNLSGYGRDVHKAWDSYLKDCEMFMEESIDKKSNRNYNSNDDLSWLDEL